MISRTRNLFDDQDKSITADHAHQTPLGHGNFAAGRPQFAVHLHGALVAYQGLGLSLLPDER
jgi:hypothetical protein